MRMRNHPILSGLLLLAAMGLLFVLVAVVFQSFSRDRLVRAPEGKVAVVPVEGMISDSRDLVEQLDQYEKDRTVRAIIIRINSPGGGVVPSQEIYDKILKVKKTKPVVTSMGVVAASGGYYIASATDRIMANPGTITGSIGVIMQFSQIDELLEKIGLRARIIKSGEFKDTGSPLRDMTSEELSYLQGVVDDIHQQFIEAVMANRSLSPEQLEGATEARIYTGRQALEEGLVDELGGLEDAIAMVAEMAGITGEPKVIYPRRQRGLLQYIISETASGVTEALSKNTSGINYLYREDRVFSN